MSALGALLSTAYVVGLLVIRRAFYAKMRRGAIYVAATALVVGMLLVVGVGLVLIAWLPNDLDPVDRLSWMLFAASGFGESVPDIFEAHAPPGLGTALSLLSAAVLLLATALLFRSQRARHTLGATDEHVLRTLATRFGEQDSLASFSTRRDRSVIYSPDGRAAVTYRVELGVCLAAGDSVGEPGSWGQAVEAWLDLAREHGWVPAVMGASRQGAEAYAAARLAVLHLGDEAILGPPSSAWSTAAAARTVVVDLPLPGGLGRRGDGGSRSPTPPGQPSWRYAAPLTGPCRPRSPCWSPSADVRGRSMGTGSGSSTSWACGCAPTGAPRSRCGWSPTPRT